MSADRLPAIIQAMQDAAREAGDLVLASALTLTASPAEVAPLLPLTGADAMQGAGLYALTLDPDVSGATAASLGAADHALACRVAARLASTACLIIAIDAKGHHDAAGALWRAAAHLTSLPADVIDDSSNAISACAGVEIDAREVRPGSVVLHEPTDYFGSTVTVRLTNGNGWHCEGSPSEIGWGWPSDCGFDRCRELATALTAKECTEVAAMGSADAIAWCESRAVRLAYASL